MTVIGALIRPCVRPCRGRGGSPAADADLALVPADAVGFVHVRAADLWKNEMFAGFRQTFEKAGPKALAALDAQFVPKVSTFDRATGFLLLDEETAAAAVHRAALHRRRSTRRGGQGVPAGRREDRPRRQDRLPRRDVSTSTSTSRTTSTSSSRRPAAMTTFLRHESPKTGPLSHGLKLAASGKPVIGVASTSRRCRSRARHSKDLPPEVFGASQGRTRHALARPRHGGEGRSRRGLQDRRPGRGRREGGQGSGRLRPQGTREAQGRRREEAVRAANERPAAAR